VSRFSVLRLLPGEGFGTALTVFSAARFDGVAEGVLVVAVFPALGTFSAVAFVVVATEAAFAGGTFAVLFSLGVVE